MMARGQHHVTHPAFFGQSCPGVGVKVLRFELAGQLGVLAHWNLLIPLHPFAPARNRVDAPVQEHADTRLAPPGNSLCRVRILRQRRPLGRRHSASKKEEAEQQDCAFPHILPVTYAALALICQHLPYLCPLCPPRLPLARGALKPARNRAQTYSPSASESPEDGSILSGKLAIQLT